MTSDAPAEPEPLFSGLTESEAQKLWRQGVILAALSLAQQSEAHQAAELEPAPETQEKAADGRNRGPVQPERKAPKSAAISRARRRGNVGR